MDITDVLLQIFLAFTVARLLGRGFARLALPAVIGELLAGAILGPQLLDLVHDNESMHALAELGVIMLLFSAGLETHIQELTEVRSAALRVAVLGAVLPFVFGAAGGFLFGYSVTEALFVGTALMATSVGITIRVLQDLGFQKRKSVRIILAAAVLDDVLGLVTLSLVTALALGEANILELGLLAVEAVAYVAFFAFLGPRFVQRGSAALARFSVNFLFEIAIILTLALSLLADYIGLAAIVGAFLAGLIIAELKQHVALEDKFQPLAWFFVPFFFVLMGTYIDFGSFTQPAVLFAVVVFTVIAIVTKFGGALLGSRRESPQTAAEVGVGMIPRGEVGIVVAGIALAANAISEDIYASVLGMVLATTIAAPFVIKRVYRRRSRAPGRPPANAESGAEEAPGVSDV